MLHVVPYPFVTCKFGDKNGYTLILVVMGFSTVIHVHQYGVLINRIFLNITK